LVRPLASATWASVSPDGQDSYRERETIVFRADADQLIAIHEHLSPVPEEKP
jgi:hypothetical protein